MFLLDKPFQPSLMFAGMAGAYKSEVPFRCSTSLGKDKHVSLLRKFVNYGRKKLITMTLGVNDIKRFFVADILD